jgi:hypothetical protein
LKTALDNLSLVAPRLAETVIPSAPDYFFSDTLEQYFPIRLTHKSIDYDEVIYTILGNRNIENDSWYSKLVDERTPALQYFVSNNFDSNKRLYVQYISQEKGFGVYSTLPILKGQPVVECTGTIANMMGVQSQYSWWYPGNFDLRLQLGVDASVRGNIARFVNHDENNNMEPVVVPQGNRWHIVYVAKRNIPVDEELTVTYGSQFWEAER